MKYPRITLLTFCLAAPSFLGAQDIYKDTFKSSSPMTGRKPDTVNQPGLSYRPVGNHEACGQPVIADGTLTLNVDEGVALAFGNAPGSQLSPKVSVVADVQIGTLTGNNPAYRGMGLGFWSELGTVHAINHFTGLALGLDGTTRVIVDGGDPAVSSQPYAGTFDASVVHRLAYTVDTTTGSLLNISMDGKAVAVTGLPNNLFKFPALNYVGVYANSGSLKTAGTVSYFSVSASLATTATGSLSSPTPPAAATAPGFVRAKPPPEEGFLPPMEAVYQWSVRVGDDPYRRAYLWIPENCPRVRGIIIGIQNMLEESMFADPAIRRAATAENLGIVWITPGDDEKRADTKFPDLMHKFDPSPEAVKQVQAALTDLANESGYAEIADAPVIVTAHSAATPFVWGMGWNFDPARMVAIFPCKGWFTGGLRPGVPVFHISSEYAEVGGKDWGETYLKDRVEMQRLRAAGPDPLAGEFVDIGAGHYEWNPDSADVVAMFIQKAAHYRIPPAGSANGQVALKPVDPESGWLIDPAKLGAPEGKPVPASQWTGDPAKAFWYFDEEMARAVNDSMVAALARKPQVLTVMNDGKPITDYSGGGVASVWPTLLPDGATFRVEGGFLDLSPTEKLYRGVAVGHAPGPILFKVGGGALRQTGPDTFRVCMRRGGLVPQGLPWGPHLIAFQLGDREYRRADRPMHVFLGTVNKIGASQTITFPKIADQRAGPGHIKLQAASSTGLPVQFYAVSGPVQIDPLDNTKLDFVKIPTRAKFPMRVVIGAYQPGHLSEPKVQNAEPVFQEFMLQR